MSVAREPSEGLVVNHLQRLFGMGTVTGLTEGQLLERFVQSRDEMAFEMLLERHGPMVLGVCRQWLSDPNDVDDAFQATFLVLVRKAGSLRQRELLGNWLYGVASRVAARARSRAFRGRVRRVSVDDLAATETGHARGAGSPSESVLRAEDRPLVHEEVGRLPSKYRLPIVLCYFEGKTHEQAALQLGWPVGTVKGRLSRARDLLRGRLTRRGVTAPPSVVLAALGGPELRVPLPASLTRSTVQAAMSVVSKAGGKLAADAAVSLTVASLTEGAIQTMVVSQLKSLALSAAVAAGLLTTGAVSLAYQRLSPERSRSAGAARPAPAAKPSATVKTSTTPRSSPAAKSEPAEDRKDAGDESLQADIQTALRTLAGLEKSYLSGEEGVVVDPSLFYNWSLNLMEAQRLEAKTDEERQRAVAGHRNRIADLHAGLKGLSQEGKVPKSAVLSLESYLKQAERLSAAAKSQTPAAPFAGGMGGMGGMMGIGGGTAPAEQSGVDVGVPNAGHMLIARATALLATADKTPQNQEAFKALEHPASLQFPTETPLRDVLAQIRAAAKDSNGKPIPIYVDPVGLQEAERTLDSPVTINLADVPLKFSLRLVLKQLGLAYCVRDGVLIISSVEGIEQEIKEALAEEVMRNPETARKISDLGGLGLPGLGRGMMGGGMGGGMR
jgi:RNA polymerase sigma factor (sigma-70 family)